MKFLFPIIALMFLTNCTSYKDARPDPEVREYRQIQQAGEKQENPVEKLAAEELERRKRRDIIDRTRYR